MRVPASVSPAVTCRHGMGIKDLGRDNQNEGKGVGMGADGTGKMGCVGGDSHYVHVDKSLPAGSV